MLRKGIALLMTVVLLMSFGTVIHAAEGEEKVTYGELLFELGLINGSGNGLDEDKELTREQMVAILNRMSAREGDEAFTPPAVPTFSDVPKSNWAYADIEKAYASGITSGIGEGKFGLGGKVTHQQAVTFLARVAGYEIDYANAIDEGWEIGIWLLSDKPATANLYRGDIFELMAGTLGIPVDEDEEIYLIHLIPSISPEQLELFMNSNALYVYNPMWQDFTFEPIPDTYKGNDEHFAKASLLQFQHTKAASEVIDLFRGMSDEVDFESFFKLAAAGQSSIALPYEWSVYEDSEEWGEYGYYGKTHAEMTADGLVTGDIESTEENDALTASQSGVWKYEQIVVDGKKVTPYYVMMEMPAVFEGDYGFYELFVLLDDKGVYKAAALGSYGAGVFVRQ